jgi:hypothetical protein
MIEENLLKDYKIAKSEKLCPAKCQGMSFLIYTDETVKCRTCGKISKQRELLVE